MCPNILETIRATLPKPYISGAFLNFVNSLFETFLHDITKVHLAAHGLVGVPRALSQKLFEIF